MTGTDPETQTAAPPEILFYWDFPETKTATVIIDGKTLEGVFVEVTKWRLIASDGARQASIESLGPVTLLPVTDPDAFQESRKVSDQQFAAWFEASFGEGAVSQARYRASQALAAIQPHQSQAAPARSFSTLPEALMAQAVEDAGNQE